MFHYYRYRNYTTTKNFFNSFKKDVDFSDNLLYNYINIHREGVLVKWHFNKKNTTYAIYVCGIILFATLCINFMVNKGSFDSVLDTLNEMFSPIIFGIVIAYLINPILRMFEKMLSKLSKGKMSKLARRALGMVFTYIVLIGVLTGFICIIAPQLVKSISDMIDQAMNLVNTVPAYIQNLIDNNENFAEIYVTLVNDFDIWGKLAGFADNLTNLLKSSIGIITSIFFVLKNFFLGIFFSIYFLASKEVLIAQIKRFFLAFFSFKHNVALGHFMTTVDQKFGQFIRGKIIDSMIVMTIVYILTWIFDMPYYPMIALIIGVTDLIPVFGPFLGAIPSAIIILIAPSGGIEKTLIFALLILIVQQIDGNIIAPNILGDKVGLSGVWVMIAIIVMGGLFGIMGMFFGVPIFAVIYTLVGEGIHKKLVKKGLAEQLEDDTPVETKERVSLFKRIKNKIFAAKSEADASEKDNSEHNEHDVDDDSIK